MCNHNEAHFLYENGYFRYHCPTCGLMGPRGERASEAKRGWIAVRDGRTYHCGANPRPLKELSHTVPQLRLGSSLGTAVDLPLAPGPQKRCKP